MRVQDIHFFYINCKKDITKNSAMKSQWDECCLFFGHQIPLIRRDAVHFLDFTFPYYTETYQADNSKIKNQLANTSVYKSHTNLWKYIWDSHIKYAFIFEDDVIIPKTFLKDLEDILNDYSDFSHDTKKWDILFFGILSMMAKKTEEYEDFYKVLNKKGYNNGLHAYMLNHESAGRLLSLIFKNGISNQIDIFLRDNADKYNFLVYKDLIIKQNVDNLESTRLGKYVDDTLKKRFDEIHVIS